MEDGLWPWRLTERRYATLLSLTIKEYYCCKLYTTITFLFSTFQKTFHYDSKFWSDKNIYNLPGGKTGFDSEETKLPTYWNTPFSKICATTDSRIGFGTGGYQDDTITCGNYAIKGYTSDNGEKHIKAMGYILVQWQGNHWTLRDMSFEQFPEWTQICRCRYRG